MLELYLVSRQFIARRFDRSLKRHYPGHTQVRTVLARTVVKRAEAKILCQDRALAVIYHFVVSKGVLRSVGYIPTLAHSRAAWGAGGEL